MGNGKDKYTNGKRHRQPSEVWGDNTTGGHGLTFQGQKTTHLSYFTQAILSEPFFVLSEVFKGGGSVSEEELKSERLKLRTTMPNFKRQKCQSLASKEGTYRCYRHTCFLSGMSFLNSPS